jgi:proteic killer suppression protein
VDLVNCHRNPFVTKNWRMTFRITETGAIEDMDLEDYH